MKDMSWSKAAIAFLVVAASVGVLGGPVQATKLGDVDVSGYVDVYTALNLNRPAALSIPLHVFEGADNAVGALNRVELVFDNPRWRFDLGYGAADFVTQGGAYPPVPAPILNIQQAYVKWPVSWMKRDISIDVGKFVTHNGFEVIESKDNWIYSRGLLFQFAIPYWHAGVRASTAINDKWTAMGTVFNGWQVLAPALQRAPAFGLQLIGRPIPQLLTVFNYTTGLRGTAGQTTGLVDVVAIYDVNPALSIGFNYDTATFRPATAVDYSAFALYGKYAMAMGTLLGRYESVSDPNVGILPLGAGVTSASSITVGYDVPLQTNTLGRVEYRMDTANLAVFPSSGAAQTSQNVITAGLVTTF